MKFRNQMIGWVLFSTVLSLFVSGFNIIQEEYSLTDGDVDGSGNTVLEKLNNLNLIQGMNTVADDFTRLTTPQNGFDILGGLLGVALGGFQTILGIITTPLEVLDAIIGFYYIPSIVYLGIGAIFVIVGAFSLLEATSGKSL